MGIKVLSEKNTEFRDELNSFLHEIEQNTESGDIAEEMRIASVAMWEITKDDRVLFAPQIEKDPKYESIIKKIREIGIKIRFLESVNRIANIVSVLVFAGFSLSWLWKWNEKRKGHTMFNGSWYEVPANGLT